MRTSQVLLAYSRKLKEELGIRPVPVRDQFIRKHPSWSPELGPLSEAGGWWPWQAVGYLPSVSLTLCLSACADPSRELSPALSCLGGSTCCLCLMCISHGSSTLRAQPPRSGVGSSRCLSLSCWKFLPRPSFSWAGHGPGTPSCMDSF